MSLLDKIKKIKSKKFMDAIVAGCAMIAFADELVKSEEIAKMADFIRIDNNLKIFDLSEVMDAFDSCVQEFEFDYRLGREKAFRAIDKIRDNPEEARLLVLVCGAVASADDELNVKERNVLKDICRFLGLNPIEFDLLKTPASPFSRSQDRAWDREKEQESDEIIQDSSKTEKSRSKDNGMPEWMRNPSKIAKPKSKDDEMPEWMRDTSKITKPKPKDDGIPEWMRGTSKITKPKPKDDDIPEWMRDTSKIKKPKPKDDGIPEWMKKKSQK